jgi:hypothetical protein
MTDDDPGGDALAALRAEHPGWTITASWVTASTGPDVRLVRAERGTIRLVARDPGDLARQIDTVRRAGY